MTKSLDSLSVEYIFMYIVVIEWPIDITIDICIPECRAVQGSIGGDAISDQGGGKANIGG